MFFSFFLRNYLIKFLIFIHFLDLYGKFYTQTFHSNTYPNDLYGSSTIINNQIEFNKGLLTRALVEGKYYIADELNISPISTILSIEPILDLIF